MLIIEKKPKCAVSEFYRSLRTNIEYSTFDEKLKTILVTSAQRGEGKSTICGNMALSFAENDKKVLLIDCDLRTPYIHKLFNMANTDGLSDVLVGSKKIDEAIRPYSSSLDILPCGTIPPNPAKMIESKSLENVLQSLKEKYDVIIIDSPPVNAVTDPQILATKVDGTVLVVKKEVTKLESLKEAKVLLEKVKANIVGCVLNGIERPKKKDYVYYSSNEKSKA